MAKAYTYMESNQLQKLPQACQKVAEQYRQLEAEAEKGDDFNSWRVMTKMHLFQHLCEMGSSCKDALKSWKGGLASKTCQPFPEFALAPPIASHCLPARGKPELEDQHNPCKTQQEKRIFFTMSICWILRPLPKRWLQAILLACKRQLHLMDKLQA